MGILDFFKKKPKASRLDIPPPPGVSGPESISLPPEPKQKSKKELPLPKLPEQGMPKEKPKQGLSIPPPKKEWNQPSAPLLRKRLSELKKRKEDLHAGIPKPKFDIPKPPRPQITIPRPPEPNRNKKTVLREYKPFVKKEIKPVMERAVEETPEEPAKKFWPLKEKPSRAYNQPKFVGVQDFQYILNKINHMRKKLTDSEKTIKKMNDLKNQEEKLLEEWSSRVETIEKRLNQADAVIHQGE